MDFSLCHDCSRRSRCPDSLHPNNCHGPFGMEAKENIYNKCLNCSHYNLGCKSNPDTCGNFVSKMPAQNPSYEVLKLCLITASEQVLTSEEKALMADGNKIQAIKRLRERIQCGLAEGKYLVEAYLDSDELKTVSIIITKKEQERLRQLIQANPDFISGKDLVLKSLFSKVVCAK